MLISALAPLIAEPVRQRVVNFFNGNASPQNVNHFLGQVTPMIKELPENLQLEILKLSKGFWDEQAKDNQKKQPESLPRLGKNNHIP